MYVTDHDYPRRFHTIGYEAHLDPVSEDELKQWRRAFTNLRVVNDESIKINQTDNVEQYVFESDCNPLNDNILNKSVISNSDRAMFSVVGRKLDFHNVTLKTEAMSFDDDETFEAEGVEDEVICLDRSDEYLPTHVQSEDQSVSSDEAISPSSVRRLEISDQIFEKIWPRVIDHLKPFLLSVSKEFIAQREGS